MLPPIHTIEQFVKTLRTIYPTADIGWPRTFAESLTEVWRTIYQSYQLALDDQLDWAELYPSQTQGQITLLRAAFVAHLRSDQSEQFLTPGRLNQQARLIVNHRLKEKLAQEEVARRTQERNEIPQKRGSKCGQLFFAFCMARGYAHCNAENPFAPVSPEAIARLERELNAECQRLDLTYYFDLSECLPRAPVTGSDDDVFTDPAILARKRQKQLTYAKAQGD